MTDGCIHDEISESQQRIERLRINADIKMWRGEQLNGCQCAYYESHAGKCLGADCFCH